MFYKITFLFVLFTFIHSYAENDCENFLLNTDPIFQLRSIEKYLGDESRYILTENMTKSSNKTFVVIDVVSGKKVALYKPDEGIHKDVENLYPVLKKNISLREEISYWVSQELEFSDIAPSIKVSKDRFKGALVLWKDGFKNYYDFWVSRYQSYPTEEIDDLEYLLEERENSKVQELAVFDYLIGNLDRNLKNLLIKENGQIIGIDHSLSFPILPTRKFGTVNLGWDRGETTKTLVSDRLLSKVQGIQASSFINSMKAKYPDLDHRALSLTKERIKIFQFLIKKRFPIKLKTLSMMLRYHSLYLSKMKSNQIKSNQI